MLHTPATPSTLLTPEGQCFQIPPFQRNYAWSPTRIQKLLFDVAVATTQETKHWIGIMLAGVAPPASKCGTDKFGHTCWLILDGQQRIVTLRLCLLAICDEFERQTGAQPTQLDRAAITDVAVHGLDAEDWSHIGSHEVLRHTEHRIDSAEAKLRLCDAYLFIRWVLLSGQNSISEEFPSLPPPNQSAEALIESWVTDSANPASPELLMELAQNILTKLEISLLQHENEKDEPVETIFESLNGHRTELSQYDLFRNFVLTQANLQGEAQKDLYERHMKGGEKEIDQAPLDYKDEKGNLQIFLGDFVTILRARDSNVTVARANSAQRFKEWWNREQPNLQAFVKDSLSPTMRTWRAAAGGERFIRADAGNSHELPEAAVRSIWRIEMFSRGPLTPLVTVALSEWMKSDSPERDNNLCQTLKCLETLLARMLLAGSSLSGRRRALVDSIGLGVGTSVNATALWVAEQAPSDRECQRVALQSNNTSFGDALPQEEWYVSKDLYSRSTSRPVIALFDGLVQFQDGLDFSTVLALKPGTRAKGKKARSIEHHYPQNPSSQWFDDLREWDTEPALMVSRLHSIGNLTVLPQQINSRFQRSRHSDKQEMLGGEEFPSLKVNTGLMSSPKWTPAEIDRRAEDLVTDALTFWELPNVQRS